MTNSFWDKFSLAGHCVCFLNTLLLSSFFQNINILYMLEAQLDVLSKNEEINKPVAMVPEEEKHRHEYFSLFLILLFLRGLSPD